MKLNKHKIVLDFDDTLVNSSEQIISMLNTKYNLNKTIDDLKDWGYNSIYRHTTSKEISEFFASEEFFDNVLWNEGAQEFLLKFKDTYEFIICSKGCAKNLELKNKFLDTWFKENKVKDWKFIGIETNDVGNSDLDKSSIDFSDCLFCVEDNTNALNSLNTPKKFLIKNYRELPWNEIPINADNVYVINNFYELIEICQFDEKLRKEGIYIG